MSQFPTYDFTDAGLDYADVEDTVNEMASYLNSLDDECCSPATIKKTLDEVWPIMLIMVIDREKPNTARYKAGVQNAYELLYPLT